MRNTLLPTERRSYGLYNYGLYTYSLYSYGLNGYGMHTSSLNVALNRRTQNAYDVEYPKSR